MIKINIFTERVPKYYIKKIWRLIKDLPRDMRRASLRYIFTNHDARSTTGMINIPGELYNSPMAVPVGLHGLTMGEKFRYISYNEPNDCLEVKEDTPLTEFIYVSVNGTPPTYMMTKGELIIKLQCIIGVNCMW